MSERFLKRWSRLKGEGAVAEVAMPAPVASAPVPASAPAPACAPTPAAVAASAPAPASAQAKPALPSLADAAKLGADSDYSAFVARGVDQPVRQLALKKLFADPHFNMVDGLDIYMGDYNKADPMPAAMLAALHAAKEFLVQDIEQDINQDINQDDAKGPE